MGHWLGSVGEWAKKCVGGGGFWFKPSEEKSLVAGGGATKHSNHRGTLEQGAHIWPVDDLVIDTAFAAGISSSTLLLMTLQGKWRSRKKEIFSLMIHTWPYDLCAGSLVRNLWVHRPLFQPLKVGPLAVSDVKGCVWLFKVRTIIIMTSTSSLQCFSQHS